MSGENTAHNALEVLNLNAKRVEQLSARRTRIQVQLESAQANYEKAVKEAELEFGTADLDQLRTLLKEKVSANNKAVEDFVSALNTFEAHLTQIERALADPEALDAYLQSMPSQPAILEANDETHPEDEEAPLTEEASTPLFEEEDI